MNDSSEPEALVRSPQPAAAQSRAKRAWATLREAIRGSQQDFTEGPIGRAIFLLAVPMVMETALESIFAVEDIFFVSKLGPDAVAAVGITESMMTILYAVALGLSMAATATVARRIGEKNPEAASVAAVQIIVVGVVVSLVLGVAGALFAPRLLALLGASPGVISVGSGYAALMLGGNATVLLLFLINAIFRGAGDASIAMRVLWFGNAINIVLDPCLIFGLGPFPEMGVTGAAVGNNVGRGAAVLWQLWILTRGKGRVTVRRRHMRLEPKVMANLLRLSGSGIVQITIGTASWLGLIRILTSFGSAAVAGYTIGIRIIIFALLPSWGLSNAGATMVGQSLGAGKPDRAERSVWMAAFYNMIFLGGVGLTFVLAARPISASSRRTPRSLASAPIACGLSATVSSSMPTGWSSSKPSTAQAIHGRPPRSTFSASGSGRSRSPGSLPRRLASGRAASLSPSRSLSRRWRSSQVFSSEEAGGSRRKSSGPQALDSDRTIVLY